MSNKLLTEQELEDALNGWALKYSVRSSDAPSASKDLSDLIQSQKLAHGEMVIGEDIPQYGDKTSKGIWYEAQQALVTEQRERNV